MTNFGKPPFPRGKGWFNDSTLAANSNNWTESTQYEGQLAQFADRNPTTGVQRTHAPVVARVVRNVSGISLLPGRAVKWAAGYRNRRVDGYVCETGEEVAGIVDEYLPSSGVDDGDLFWLVQRGPSLWLSNLANAAGNNVSEGDRLVSLTAATSQATTAGRWTKLPSVAATTNQTTALNAHLNDVMKYERNVAAVALSSNTTNQTNRQLLVDVQIY